MSIQKVDSTGAAFEFNGEQVVEGGTPDRIWRDHEARYGFCVPFVTNRSVLDAACGTGYGSFALACGGAKSVVGVDINESAVKFASDRYSAQNLQYVKADAACLDFADSSFDVVVSFETIEHVDDAEALLAEFDRILVENGVLIVSTPNRTVTSPMKRRDDPPDNRFHRMEYIPFEFDDLLAPRFGVLARYGQRMVPRFLYNPSILRFGLRVMPYAYAPKHGSPTPAPLSPAFEPRYLVYVCKKGR